MITGLLIADNMSYKEFHCLQSLDHVTISCDKNVLADTITDTYLNKQDRNAYGTSFKRKAPSIIALQYRVIQKRKFSLWTTVDLCGYLTGNGRVFEPKSLPPYASDNEILTVDTDDAKKEALPDHKPRHVAGNDDNRDEAKPKAT